ncbi:MAG: hypothetical protein ABR606_01390 [Vicinamibacterales bacterium]
MSLSGQIERLWDAGEHYVARHRRKCIFAGFFIIFLPQWAPSAYAAVMWLVSFAPRDAVVVSPAAILTTVPDFSFSVWNWVTAPLGFVVMFWVYWSVRKRTLVEKSYREAWIAQAEAFDKLAQQDHYHRAPGEPMPAVSKVRASHYSGKWEISGGLTSDVRKDVEVQCGAAGHLLRYTQRSKTANMSVDDLQAWVQFVADSGEVTSTFTGTSTRGEVTTDWTSPQIDALATASGRACRRCAAVEPP